MVLKLNHYIWLTAFLCSLFFINAWQLELFASAIIFISLWSVFTLVKLTNDKGLIIPKSWCLAFMGAFWLLAFLSILGSDIINVSVMAFCFFSVLPLTFFVMILNNDEVILKTLVKIIAVVFAVMTLWALVQFFVFNDFFQGRARHPLKNPNSLSAIFSLAIFCGIGAIFYLKELKDKKWAVAFVVLMIGGLIVTGSRGAFFALIPFMTVFLFMMRDGVIKHYKLFLVIAFSSITFFFLSSFGSEISQNFAFRVFQTVTLQSENITSNRTSLWLATIDIIKEHGVFGTGIGTYFLYFPEFRLSTDRSGAYYAHSDPLQYWVELGILGPVLFYGFIIAVVARTVAAVKKASDQKDKIAILTPFFALAACMLHTHVTFNLYNLSILFLVGFLLSIWFIQTQKVLKTAVWNIQFPVSYSKASRIVLITMPFIFIVGIFSAYVLSEVYTNKARDHLFRADLDAFAKDIIMANKLSLNGNYRSYLLAVNVPMTLLQDQSDSFNEEQKKEIFDQALSYLRQVKAINPRSASTYYYLARIQQLVPKEFVPEDLKNSQSYYERALELDPIHIGSRIQLSFIYERDLLSFDRALALMEEGANYRYATSKEIDLYARLAELYLKAGNKEGRDKALQKMIAVKKRLDRSKERQERGLRLN